MLSVFKRPSNDEQKKTEDKISRLRKEVRKQADIRETLVAEISQNLDSMRSPAPLLFHKGVNHG